MNRIFENMKITRTVMSLLLIAVPVLAYTVPAVALKYTASGSSYVEPLSSISYGLFMGLGVIGTVSAVMFIWLGEPLLSLFASVFTLAPVAGAVKFTVQNGYSDLHVTFEPGFYVLCFVIAVAICGSVFLFVSRGKYIGEKETDIPEEEGKRKGGPEFGRKSEQKTAYKRKKTVDEEWYIFDQLKRYRNLYDAGVITEEEFNQKKRELLQK